ncbi:hypothetical protein FGKAn22_11440 [Ferrigenium kumadai]|uniref:Uncharacterized protein n=2 Tax=Ferrigenium kumadai TaxID=1682490 RepID=A0AAN1SZD7_9PROT|nr:hypothetical protein FGKAn22_11440 [Ferrigenium kumadai]
MIALGSSALMEGFALIGFETHADPEPEAVENLLQELIRNQQAALVVIEQRLTRNPGRHLMHAQNEGGRIVITEIPGIGMSDAYHSRAENLVQNILGPAALEVQE